MRGKFYPIPPEDGLEKVAFPLEKVAIPPF